MTDGTSERVRVLVVDDHPLLRVGLVEMIQQEPDMEVCGQAGGADEAVRLIEEHGPDLMTLDISLPGKSGLELLKDLRHRYPELHVLVVSMHDESLYAERVLRAGARGFITKEEAVDRVVEAIRVVQKGELYVSKGISNRLVEKLVVGGGGSPLERLSDRELEVFRLLGQGRGTRQIAEELHLSIKTIETHRANIKQKLNLKSATELVRHAVQWAEKG